MKVLKIFFLLFIVIAVGGYIAYTTLIPDMINKTIASGEIPSIIPEKYHGEIQAAQEMMNEEIQNLPEVMLRYDLSYDELLQFARQIENDEIINALDELQTTRIESSNQAFDIVMSHIDADLPQSDKVRQLFSDKVPVNTIQSELDKMQESFLPLNVSVDLARRFGIEMLVQKKDEIEQRLQQLQPGQ